VAEKGVLDRFLHPVSDDMKEKMKDKKQDKGADRERDRVETHAWEYPPPSIVEHEKI
jgi:hypothetical protein